MKFMSMTYSREHEYIVVIILSLFSAYVYASSRNFTKNCEICKKNIESIPNIEKCSNFRKES